MKNFFTGLSILALVAVIVAAFVFVDSGGSVKADPVSVVKQEAASPPGATVEVVKADPVSVVKQEAASPPGATVEVVKAVAMESPYTPFVRNVSESRTVSGSMQNDSFEVQSVAPLLRAYYNDTVANGSRYHNETALGRSAQFKADIRYPIKI